MSEKDEARKNFLLALDQEDDDEEDTQEDASVSGAAEYVTDEVDVSDEDETAEDEDVRQTDGSDQEDDGEVENTDQDVNHDMMGTTARKVRRANKEAPSHAQPYFGHRIKW